MPCNATQRQNQVKALEWVNYSHLQFEGKKKIRRKRFIHNKKISAPFEKKSYD